MNILEEGILLLYENLEVDLAVGRFLQLLVVRHQALMGSCWWLLPNRFYVSPESNAFAQWRKSMYEASFNYYQMLQEGEAYTHVQPAFLEEPLTLLRYALIYQKQVVGICSFILEEQDVQKALQDQEFKELLKLLALLLWQTDAKISMRQVKYEVVSAMVSVIEALDSYTCNHSKNVANYALFLAEELNLPPQDIETVYYGALFHDIGKIGVPISILQKPSELTEKEFEIIKCHPEKGAGILQNFEQFKSVIPIVKHHHEFFNGKGYPDGLSKEDIPLGARIVSVVDAYDAITSNRSYDKAKAKELAINKIVQASSIQFDPDIVAAFLRIVNNF